MVPKATDPQGHGSRGPQGHGSPRPRISKATDHVITKATDLQGHGSCDPQGQHLVLPGFWIQLLRPWQQGLHSHLLFKLRVGGKADGAALGTEGADAPGGAAAVNTGADSLAAKGSHGPTLLLPYCQK
eukprot:1159695-Pelagomonas_calceolata.AAC.2